MLTSSSQSSVSTSGTTITVNNNNSPNSKVSVRVELDIGTLQRAIFQQIEENPTIRALKELLEAQHQHKDDLNPDTLVVKAGKKKTQMQEKSSPDLLEDNDVVHVTKGVIPKMFSDLGKTESEIGAHLKKLNSDVVTHLSNAHIVCLDTNIVYDIVLLGILYPQLVGKTLVITETVWSECRFSAQLLVTENIHIWKTGVSEDTKECQIDAKFTVNRTAKQAYLQQSAHQQVNTIKDLKILLECNYLRHQAKLLDLNSSIVFASRNAIFELDIVKVKTMQRSEFQLLRDAHKISQLKKQEYERWFQDALLCFRSSNTAKEAFYKSYILEHALPKPAEFSLAPLVAPSSSRKEFKPTSVKLDYD